VATIKATTVLAHPETHEPTVLLAGTEAPDWAVDKITNPDVLEQPGAKKAPAKSSTTKATADKADADKPDG
jgi:hypothetical protein